MQQWKTIFQPKHGLVPPLHTSSLFPSLPCSSWSPAKNGHLHNFHPLMGEKQRLRFEASLGLLIRCLPGLLHLLPPAPPPPSPAPAASLLWSSDAAFNYQPTTAATLAGKTESERQKHRQKEEERGREVERKKQVRPASQDAARMLLPGHCAVLRCQLKQNLIFSNFQTTNSNSNNNKGSRSKGKGEGEREWERCQRRVVVVALWANNVLEIWRSLSAL